MKTWVLALLATLTLVWPCRFAAAEDNDPKVVKCVLLLSPEIDCPACEEGIKHLLVTTRGVQSADIDVLTNRVTVRYEPARINVRALIGRIAVMGYKAEERR